MLLFGPAGIPKQAAARDSEAGIARVKEVGLGCMELEFVRRVSMGEEKAARVKATAARLEVSLTAHAPYYINFNSNASEIVKASEKRLFEAARIGALCGATSVAFHPGFYMGEPPAKALRNVKKHLREVRKRCHDTGVEIQLRPETTGKPAQFGRLEEALELSTEIDGVLPCVDFAHMHAYEGRMNSYDEFAAVLEKIRSGLGKRAIRDMHIHASGIRYGKRGELEHLNLDESDFNYSALMRTLKDFSAGGRLICESPDREIDALLMKREYEGKKENPESADFADSRRLKRKRSESNQ
ncbi:MAG: TIM barrel protein [Candidatus Lindowbacteria bacterium]|nr:TIM barrel protein [Candidatus Lindowbacteria bacterium]